MSNQANQNNAVNNTAVYNEKKIATYDSLFRESNLAKPMEVSLTITAAHLFGQAYIMEQQGTKEGDPVYERFVCPLEDITKVYINNNVKASPLYVQCDTSIKGVVYRKRIIVPCLENVSEIVKQINSVREAHMEKYEAAVARENEKKRKALEAARLQEKAESASKVEENAAEAVAETAAEAVSAPVEEIAAKPKTRKKKESSSKQINELKKLSLDLDEIPSSIDIAKADAPEDFKAAAAEALEIFSDVKSKPAKKEEPVAETVSEEPVSEAPAAETTAASVIDDIEKAISEAEAFAASVKAEEPAADAEIPALEEIAPVADELPEDISAPIDEIPALEETAAVEELAPEITDYEDEIPALDTTVSVQEYVEEIIPEVEDEIPSIEESLPAVEEIAPAAEEISVVEEAAPVVEEIAPAAEEEPAPVQVTSIPAPAPKPVIKEHMDNPNGSAIGLEEFQNAVLKIKSMKDNGLLTDEEFAQEKKKLLASLY